MWQEEEGDEFFGLFLCRIASVEHHRTVRHCVQLADVVSVGSVFINMSLETCSHPASGLSVLVRRKIFWHQQKTAQVFISALQPFGAVSLSK